MDKWKFVLSNRTGGHPFVWVDNDVHPMNFNKANFEYARETDQIFFRKKLKGKLKFINQKDRSYMDYDLVKGFYDDDKFQPLLLYIYRWCNKIWKLDWTGIFYPRNGRWDLDRCTCEFDIEPYDRYTCIFDSWDTEYNILTVVDTVVYRNEIPNYEYLTETYEAAFAVDRFSVDGLGNLLVRCNLVDNPPVAWDCNIVASWNSAHPCQTTYMDAVQSSQGFYPYPNLWYTQGWQIQNIKWVHTVGLNYQITITYIRETTITFDVGGAPVTPAGSWDYSEVTTLMGLPAHKWSRHPYASSLAGADWVWTNGVDTANCEHVDVNTFLGYPGGRSAVLVGDFLVGQTCSDHSEIVSDFFQWHPLNVDTDNYVTGLPNKINYLHIFQMSDWQQPTPTNPATLGMMSLKQFLDFLRIAFNAYWYVDDDGLFRIEHFSWFVRTNGFDLTSATYSEYIVAKNKFEYKDNPRNERWQFAEQYGVDFTGMDLIYAAFKDADTLTYGDSVFRTDPTAEQIDGFIMVACDVLNFIIDEAGALTLIVQNNGNLAIANLMRDWHTYDRQLPQGTLNGTITTFDSIKKMAEQDEVSIPLCCDDDFDPEKLIRTGLGWGEIGLGTFSPKTEFITLKILHD